MKILRKIIKIDESLCDGCGLCVPACAEGAIEIVDGKAKVIKDMYCDGLGACIGDCPNGALTLIEREAEPFDEKAVEEMLASGKNKGGSALPAGCPSGNIKILTPQTTCETANKPSGIKDSQSALSHWPVQIRLIPPDAPFLKNADLFIVADCVAVSYPDLHDELIKGRTVMMGCPKFDDAESYVDKFAEIFEKADINSITVGIMEVPCCSGLPAIVKKGLKKAKRNIPLEKVTISIRGKRIETA